MSAVPQFVSDFASGFSEDGPKDRTPDNATIRSQSRASCIQFAEEELRQDLEAFAGWIETAPTERAFCAAFMAPISVDELWKIAGTVSAPMATRGEAFAEVMRRFVDDNRAVIAKRATELEKA